MNKLNNPIMTLFLLLLLPALAFASGGGLGLGAENLLTLTLSKTLETGAHLRMLLQEAPLTTAVFLSLEMTLVAKTSLYQKWWGKLAILGLPDL